MKFYNRTQGLQVLSDIRRKSAKNSSFTVVIGRRRIGKTSLLIKSVEYEKFLYLFVSRKNESLLCEQFQSETENALGLKIFGKVDNFKDLFEQLLIFSIKENFSLIIDEFQEFQYVNSSIFSDIQMLWDKYKDKAKINLIVCGSIYSMMMKIFEERKEPLFGRLTSKIVIKPFTTDVLKGILSDYNPAFSPDDLLFLYMLTGGVPRYIELLMDSGAVDMKGMIERITASDSPFVSEGKDLLITEFGKEYGTYFSILQLIANGKNTQSEIDSIIGKNTGAYLSNLENEYSLVSRRKPAFSKPESRKARWFIDDNFLSFWFRFIYSNQTMIEIGKPDLLREFIYRNYEQYSGLVLEKYFRDKILSSGEVSYVGSYWDNKGENEIDIVALNEIDKTAIIAEVKRNPDKFNPALLRNKISSIKKELADYEVIYKGLSLNDL